MSGRERLSFLIAGVQKSGTSALHDYLSDVPDLQLPPAKELHFFDNEAVNWGSPDYGALHRPFAEDGRLRGEATPITLYWPNALKRVHAYRPDMRLILLFRDPVTRAYSHWRMEWARRAETLPFAAAIREGRARMKEGVPVPGFHRVWSYVERGFYGRQLARAIGLFGRERILCLPQEALDRDPNGVVRRICRFLDVPSPVANLSERKVRVAAAADYPSLLEPADVQLLRTCYAPEMNRFAAQLGDPSAFAFLDDAEYRGLGTR